MLAKEAIGLLPGLFHNVQKRNRAHDISAGKCARVKYGSIYVGFRSEVDYIVRRILTNDLSYLFRVADIGANETISFIVLDRLEILEIPSIG